MVCIQNWFQTQTFLAGNAEVGLKSGVPAGMYELLGFCLRGKWVKGLLTSCVLDWRFLT